MPEHTGVGEVVDYELEPEELPQDRQQLSEEEEGDELGFIHINHPNRHYRARRRYLAG